MNNKKGYLGRSVSIIGVGYTPMGNVRKSPEILDMTERELFSWAAIEAMEDAGIEAKEIDAFYVGQTGPARFANQLATSTGLADWIGMRNKPSISHDEACSTANVGLQLAVMAVASGVYDMVLSGGTAVNQGKFDLGSLPHMREEFDDLWFTMNALANDPAYLYPGSGMLTPLDAAAVSYAKKYGVSFDQLTKAMNQAAIIARKNAVNNPKAIFALQTYEEEASSLGFSSAEEYFNSPYNPPLGVLQRFKHTSPVADGASALIVCSTDKAKQIVKEPIEIIGMGASTSFGNQLVGTPFKGEVQAFEQAYQMANITDPYKEVEYMAIHDCSAQHYFTTTEAGGYFKPGEGWKAVLDGKTAHDGEKPVNTTGGRLSCGHPLAGAAGIEIAEAVGQMKGINGPRQMPKPPKVSAIQCYGGGYHVNVTVLR
ncbi:MAG: thiolase family protein, partial [Anaerolineaceae bacterium]|nr:thiolase family protein [Anaerolineaceae bacterium]